jgi:hypothetical protein
MHQKMVYQAPVFFISRLCFRKFKKTKDDFEQMDNDGVFQKLVDWARSGGSQMVSHYYKKERLPHTLAMTAATDFLFYGFTSDSNYLKSILSEGMEKIEKSNFKNIFKYFLFMVEIE